MLPANGSARPRAKPRPDRDAAGDPVRLDGHGVDVARLCRAIRAGRKNLEFARRQRLLTVKRLVGGHYSENGYDGVRPVNELWRFVTVMSRGLVPKVPRLLLTTNRRQDRATVAAVQLWVNRRLDKMHFAETARDVVLDALLSVGIMKVALADPAEAAAGNWGRSAGTPYACAVDLDDWVQDPRAKKFSELRFMGHRLSVPLDAVKDSKFYGPARKNLQPAEVRDHNEEGDEKIDSIARVERFYGGGDAFEDDVDLWQIYLPRKRLVYTLASDDAGGPDESSEPLRVQEWVGPDDGPYHPLVFLPVPGNPRPLAPALNLLDMDDLVNELYTKVGNQAVDQKTVLPVRQGQTEDGQRIVDARDREVVRCDGDPPLPVVFPGADPATLQTAIHARDVFNRLGGNVDQLAGGAPQADTLGQEKMLLAGATGGVAELQDATRDHIARVGRALCWYYQRDPFTTMESYWELPGVPGVGTVRRATPGARARVRWEDADVKVDPYSLQYQTPQQRLANLKGYMLEVVFPVLPLYEKQGVSVDLQRLSAIAGEYMDLPELSEVLTFQEPPPPEAAGGASELPHDKVLPPVTRRENVRVSMPGRTERGNNLNMMSALGGVNPGGDPNRGA